MAVPSAPGLPAGPARCDSSPYRHAAPRAGPSPDRHRSAASPQPVPGRSGRAIYHVPHRPPPDPASDRSSHRCGAAFARLSCAPVSGQLPAQSPHPDAQQRKYRIPLPPDAAPPGPAPAHSHRPSPPPHNAYAPSDPANTANSTPQHPDQSSTPWGYGEIQTSWAHTLLSRMPFHDGRSGKVQGGGGAG